MHHPGRLEPAGSLPQRGFSFVQGLLIIRPCWAGDEYKLLPWGQSSAKLMGVGLQYLAFGVTRAQAPAFPLIP